MCDRHGCRQPTQRITPIRQLMLVQAALLAYLITDILGDRSSTALAELNRSAIKGPDRVPDRSGTGMCLRRAACAGD